MALGCNRRVAAADRVATDLAAHVLDARVEQLKGSDSDPNSEEVEKRLAKLYGNSSEQADEAVVVLMSFYLGEHNGEELYENLLSRGTRMIPVIEHYLREQPALVDRYSKPMRLERTTTVIFLKEGLEILKVQAGARHISSTSVETAPLREQVGKCAVKLVKRPAVKFGDNLIQAGESYRATPVLRVDIEETGDVTNVLILEQSGIKRLDTLLLKNVAQWKYAPRPACGVLESNIAVTMFRHQPFGCLHRNYCAPTQSIVTAILDSSTPQAGRGAYFH
jgi:TonB family protein